MNGRHERGLHHLKERFESEPSVISQIVIGSVARGEEREDSDIDFLTVVTDEEYERRKQAGELGISIEEDDANGKAIPLSFLQEAVKRAPEPTRFAFTKAKILFSKNPQVENLVHEIQKYPEHERQWKMVSFVSQLPVHFSYLQLAEYSNNGYLLSETSHKLALFGGRLILAHNRLLYPSRKQFLKQLERAEDKPEDMLELLDTMVRKPSIATAKPFFDTVINFRDWERAKEGDMVRFGNDSDQAWWMQGSTSLEES